MTDYQDNRPAKPEAYLRGDQDPLNKVMDGFSVGVIAVAGLVFLSPLDDPEFTIWMASISASIQAVKHIANRTS